MVFKLWSSPILTQHIAEKGKRFLHLHADKDELYYTQSLPLEKGRAALFKLSKNHIPLEILPKEFNIKTRINEYGGKCFTVFEGWLYFFNSSDQSLYQKSSSGELKKIFHHPSMQFADLQIDASRSFLYAIAEEVFEDNAFQSIIQLDLNTLQLKTLHRGCDFYACARLSPCGTKLAWISWNHPHMPWDTSSLWLTHLHSNQLPKIIFENPQASVSHLAWSPCNTLYFTMDLTGFWNLYSYKDSNIVLLNSSAIDFGAAFWIFGIERLCFLSQTQLAMVGTQQGIDHLYLFDTISKELRKIDLPFSSLQDLYPLSSFLVSLASSFSLSPSLVSIDIQTLRWTLLDKTQSSSIPEAFISKPKSLTIQSKAHACYGFYYPPTHSTLSSKTPPPLILRAHSGPTAHITERFSPDILYFTSRGFAVFELNYRGSSGYGRSYREALNGLWGVADVEDCIESARFLCKEGLANPHQLILKGSSAGGYTTLMTLCKTHVFQAGVAYYPVTDLKAMAKETHRFEKYYLDRLIAPLDKSEDLFKQRSPLYHVKDFQSKLLLFQGKKDPVVSASQTEVFYQKLLQNKKIASYVLFEEESHGFKQEKTLQECIEKELAFYCDCFF